MMSSQSHGHAAAAVTAVLLLAAAVAKVAVAEEYSRATTAKTAMIASSNVTTASRQQQRTLLQACTYTIQAGDTLFLLSQRFGTTVATLQELNPGIDALHLQVGQVIKLPCNHGGSSPSPMPK